jgi:hypothetical protein
LNGVIKQVPIRKKNGRFGGGRRRSRRLIYKKADELFITNVIRNTAQQNTGKRI